MTAASGVMFYDWPIEYLRLKLSHLVGKQKAADSIVSIYITSQSSHCQLSITCLNSGSLRPVDGTLGLYKVNNNKIL